MARLAKRISLSFDSFHRLANEGKWEEAFNLIDLDIKKVYETIHMDKMPHHNSIINDNEKLTLKLIGKMSAKSLENIDVDGFTTLNYVADLVQDIKLVKSIVNKSPSLVQIKTYEGLILVMLASTRGHKDLTSYLYEVTPFNILVKDGNNARFPLVPSSLVIV